jgi:hypothetical protein
LVKALNRRESEVGLLLKANSRSAKYLSWPSKSLPPSTCIRQVSSWKNTAICRSVRYPLPTCFSLIRAISCSRHWLAVTLTSYSLSKAEARVTTAVKRGKEAYRLLQNSLMSELLPWVLILRIMVFSNWTKYSTASLLYVEMLNRSKRYSCKLVWEKMKTRLFWRDVLARSRLNISRSSTECICLAVGPNSFWMIRCSQSPLYEAEAT